MQREFYILLMKMNNLIFELILSRMYESIIEVIP